MQFHLTIRFLYCRVLAYFFWKSLKIKKHRMATRERADTDNSRMRIYSHLKIPDRRISHVVVFLFWSGGTFMWLRSIFHLLWLFRESACGGPAISCTKETNLRNFFPLLNSTSFCTIHILLLYHGREYFYFLNRTLNLQLSCLKTKPFS